jgi:hypothetical protein
MAYRHSADTDVTVLLLLQNEYTAGNTNGFVFFSQQPNFVDIEPGDRRFFVEDTSSARANDKAYFDALYASFNDPSVQRAFYQFLYGRDISGRDFVAGRPVTNAFTRMVSLGKVHPALLYMYCLTKTLIEENEACKAEGRRFSAVYPVKKTDLYDKYIGWVIKEGLILNKDQLNKTGFHATIQFSLVQGMQSIGSNGKVVSVVELVKTCGVHVYRIDVYKLQAKLVSIGVRY